MGDHDSDDEEEQVSSPVRQRLLDQYNKMNKGFRKSLKKGKEYMDLIDAVSQYTELMDEYQLIYKTFDDGVLKELKDICDACNKKAVTKHPECFLDKDPKKVIQPEVKSIDDFDNFKPVKLQLTDFLNSLKNDPELADIKIEIGPYKDLLRMTQKVCEDYDANPGRLIDYIRASIVCASAKDMVRVMKALDTREESDVLRAKNGFTTSAASGGYRDIKMNMLFKSHVCEVQVHEKGFYTLKNTGGHKVYEVTRQMKVQGITDASDLFTDTTKNVMESLELMLELSYESEKSRKGASSIGAIRALMNWLDYGKCGKEQADAFKKAVDEFDCKNEKEKLAKKKYSAFAKKYEALKGDEYIPELMAEAVADMVDIFGVSHASTLLFKIGYLTELIGDDRFKESVTVAEECVKKLTEVFGEKHSETLKAKVYHCEALEGYAKQKYNEELKACPDPADPPPEIQGARDKSLLEAYTIAMEVVPILENLGKQAGDEKDAASPKDGAPAEGDGQSDDESVDNGYGDDDDDDVDEDEEISDKYPSRVLANAYAYAAMGSYYRWLLTPEADDSVWKQSIVFLGKAIYCRAKFLSGDFKKEFFEFPNPHHPLPYDDRDILKKWLLQFVEWQQDSIDGAEDDVEDKKFLLEEQLDYLTHCVFIAKRDAIVAGEDYKQDKDYQEFTRRCAAVKAEIAKLPADEAKADDAEENE
jgi:hypothetical protein